MLRKGRKYRCEESPAAGLSGSQDDKMCISTVTVFFEFAKLVTSSYTYLYFLFSSQDLRINKDDCGTFSQKIERESQKHNINKIMEKENQNYSQNNILKG